MQVMTLLKTSRGKEEGKLKSQRKAMRISEEHCTSLPLIWFTYNVKPFADKYERIFERTRIKMKGYTALQKDLLLMLFTLWKNDQTFDPNYQNQQKKK